MYTYAYLFFWWQDVAVKVFLDQHVKAEAIEEFKAEVCLSYPSMSTAPSQVWSCANCCSVIFAFYQKSVHETCADLHPAS
jgi:hypothetical protein